MLFAPAVQTCKHTYGVLRSPSVSMIRAVFEARIYDTIRPPRSLSSLHWQTFVALVVCARSLHQMICVRRIPGPRVGCYAHSHSSLLCASLCFVPCTSVDNWTIPSIHSGVWGAGWSRQGIISSVSRPSIGSMLQRMGEILKVSETNTDSGELADPRLLSSPGSEDTLVRGRSSPRPGPACFPASSATDR